MSFAWTKKPKPALHGHNRQCIGLPDEPCGKTINTRLDVPHELDSKGVMHYRCQDCYEKAERRKARSEVSHKVKAMEE